MDHKLLRGFCQKCSGSIQLLIEHKDTWSAQHYIADMLWIEQGRECGIPEPVWFLSPKQMRILWQSKEFDDFTFNELAKTLESNPFLVAKILSDAGKEN